MLVELAIVEQRYQAVLAEVQDCWRIPSSPSGSGSHGRAYMPGSRVMRPAAWLPSPTARIDRPAAPGYEGY
jgi:hypothetical protein